MVLNHQGVLPEKTEGLQEHRYSAKNFSMALERSPQTDLPQWGHWLETPNAIAIALPPSQLTVNLVAPYPLISTRFQLGQGRASFNSDRLLPYQAVPGGFDVIPSGSHYRSMESTGHCIVLALKQSLQQHLHWLDADSNLELMPGQVACNAKGQRLGEALRRFFGDRIGGALYLDSLVTLALAHVSGKQSKSRPRRSLDRLNPEQLRWAIAYIHASIADASHEQSLTLNELANELNVSPYHFAHAFKATTGIPPHRYVLRCRLEQAQRLLRETDGAIAHIAYEVGFGSQSHMTAVFRRCLQTTPSAYRRAVGLKP